MLSLLRTQLVFLDRNLPRETRFQAIIQLKNAVDQLWRVSARNCVNPEKKIIIRSRLFQGSIEEEDASLALQNALAAAKIVRIDFPQNWPDVFSGLIEILRATQKGNQPQLRGVLLILLRIIKELGTARLRKSQTALHSIAGELFFVTAELYTEKCAIWVEFLTGGRGDEDTADAALQNSLTALKLLRRLALYGFEIPHRYNAVREFWSLTQNHFDRFLSFVSHASTVPAPYQDDVGKHLLQFTKLHLDMADTHPTSFVKLPNCVQLCLAYWTLVAKFSESFEKSNGLRASTDVTEGESKSKVDGPLLERLSLKGLLLFRTCLRMVFWPHQTFRYLSPQARAEKDEAVETIRNGLLKEDFVIEMTKVIITNLFVFRRSDLESWDEDPQEWELQEHSQGSAWEWEVRPAAERLFLDLLIHYKQLLLPPLLSYVHSALQPNSDIITKEKVYATIGLSAACLGSAFDFDTLLRSSLIQDLSQNTGPESKILRRRIAIMIGQWSSVQLAPETRPLVYEIFHHLLSQAEPSNDIVVQLTAARELHNIIISVMHDKFDPKQFERFAVDIVSGLVHLIGESENDETRLAVLSTLREIVAKMEDHVKLISDFVISTLPAVWEKSGSEEYMIKQSVIAILASLIMSMGRDSPRYYNMVLPVLSQAVQPSSDLYFHLIEESLDLWEAIQMQSTPPLSPEVLSLADMAVKLLEDQTESVQKCMEVVKNYIILAPETMLSDKLRLPVLHALFSSLGARGREVIKEARHCIWMMIKYAHEIGGEAGLAAVLKDTVSNGFIANIMEKLHEAWEASQTTGPNRKQSSLSVLTEIDYFLILGRIALCDPSMFVMMLSELGQLEAVWNWLIPRWFSNFDAMSNGEWLKESCLAITRLIELPSPVQELVLASLQDYFTIWTTVVIDCRTEANNGSDAYIWANPDKACEDDTPLDILTRKKTGSWEVHSEDAWTFITVRLKDLVARVGEEAFEENWVVNVDRDIVAGFKELSMPQAGGGEG